MILAQHKRVKVAASGAPTKALRVIKRTQGTNTIGTASKDPSSRPSVMTSSLATATGTKRLLSNTSDKASIESQPTQRITGAVRLRSAATDVPLPVLDASAEARPKPKRGYTGTAQRVQRPPMINSKSAPTIPKNCVNAQSNGFTSEDRGVLRSAMASASTRLVKRVEGDVLSNIYADAKRGKRNAPERKPQPSRSGLTALPRPARIGRVAIGSENVDVKEPLRFTRR